MRATFIWLEYEAPRMVRARPMTHRHVACAQPVRMFRAPLGAIIIAEILTDLIVRHRRNTANPKACDPYAPLKPCRTAAPNGRPSLCKEVLSRGDHPWR